MGRGGVGEGVGYLLTCYKEHNEMDLHASTHKGRLVEFGMIYYTILIDFQ